MIKRRTNHAPTAMGSFVPGLDGGYTTPATKRRCARCSCKLSRYGHQWEQLCAPCYAVVHPWKPPEPRGDTRAPSRRAEYWEANKSRTCRCGKPKTDGARSCLRCYLARIGSGHPDWYGPVCACGARKSEESRMCKYCRYPVLQRPTHPEDMA